MPFNKIKATFFCNQNFNLSISQKRYTIAALYAQSYKQKDIALAIGKDPSVVSRELKRNSDGRNGHYNSDLAQRKADKRKKEKPQFTRFTQDIKTLVISLLKDHLSPEQIKGRITLLKGVIISAETIYRFIWHDKKRGGLLYTFVSTCKCNCCKHTDEFNVAKNYGWYDNLSLSGNMNRIPWSHLIYHPTYSNRVDIYDGAFTIRAACSAPSQTAV